MNTCAIQGHVSLPDSIVSEAAAFAERFYCAQESAEWADENVVSCAEPDWLKRAADVLRPNVRHLGFMPTGRDADLVMSAGVDAHTDDIYGPVLVVVLHNDGLRFKQGAITHEPAAGDWFIFDDRKKHALKDGKGRASFVGWTIPLRPIS